MSRPMVVTVHLGAAALAAIGFWMWEAEGATIWRDAIFSFCL